MSAIAKEKGNEYLHHMLREVDYESAKAIHANNVKRVIRAIEFHHMTGMKISEHNEQERQKSSPYQFCYFILNDDREHIYERINQRVDLMMEQGLLEEVKSLLAQGCTRQMVSMQGLGYKEIVAYLMHEISLEEAVYNIKRDTRHFAKRQLTWFRREPDVIFLQKEQKSTECLLQEIMIHLRERGVLTEET